MKNPSHRSLTRCAACLLAALLLVPAAAAAFSLPPGAEEQLEAAVSEAHIPAMAVAIADPDGILYARTFGKDAALDTPFLLGSLSKSFTALGIMQLKEKGLVALDAPASAYLPDIPDGITVRQLLNQTGGYGTNQRPEETAPEHAPGEHIYANLNYALLGRIIEETSGLSYEEYLQTHILGPLGMEHTSSTEAGAAERGLIQGYENWFGFPVPVDPHFPQAGDWIQPAAGYISSSAEDMARYLQMYLRGGEGILSEEGIRQMFADSVPVQAEIPYTYGFGWTTIREPLPQTVYRHSGLVETGMTCMYLLPEENLGIILMADMNDYLVGTDLLDRLGWNLVLSILGEEPEEIAPGEYWQRHGLFDLLYAALPALGVAAFWLLPKFWKKRHAVLWTVLLGLGLPSLLLAAPPLFLGEPLWVVQAFLPDFFVVLLTSALLMYAAGAVSLVRLRNIGHGKKAS